MPPYLDATLRRCGRLLAWLPLALFLCYAILVPHGTSRLWCQGPVLESLTRAYVVCLATCELLVAGLMPLGCLGGVYGMYGNAWVCVHVECVGHCIAWLASPRCRGCAKRGSLHQPDWVGPVQAWLLQLLYRGLVGDQTSSWRVGELAVCGSGWQGVDVISKS